MIRTLVFDLGGVIMDHNIPLCITKFQEILGDNIAFLGIQPNGEAQEMNEAESKRLQAVLSNAAVSSSLMHDFELGYIGTDIFVESVLALAKPGTDRNAVIQAWDAMHAGIPQYRFDWLGQWHHHYPIFALSNNNEEHWREIHESYPDFDSYFDASIVSHLVHASKPTQEIFEAAERIIIEKMLAKGLTYQRSETIFVDDLPFNRQAAQLFGWQTCASIEELATILADANG